MLSQPAQLQGAEASKTSFYPFSTFPAERLMGSSDPSRDERLLEDQFGGTEGRWGRAAGSSLSPRCSIAAGLALQERMEPGDVQPKPCCQHWASPCCCRGGSVLQRDRCPQAGHGHCSHCANIWRQLMEREINVTDNTLPSVAVRGPSLCVPVCPHGAVAASLRASPPGLPSVRPQSCSAIPTFGHFHSFSRGKW